jgi:deazaflavin-dependent oxidoreductase (nitroreductase family)
MPTADDSLKDRLARYRQITISVVGRKSGRTISVPVWLVLKDSNTLYLLPVQGSDTQWYKNVVHNPKIRISARGEKGSFEGTPITDPALVNHVVEAFRVKYGAADVKKYYSRFDVAVKIDLSRGTTLLFARALATRMG